MTKVEKCVLALVFLTTFGLASSPIESDDTFWQLQSGKYMVENTTLIRTDIFTLTSDAPRIEHCWLHDIILYHVYTVFGYKGLSLLKGFVVMVTALVLAIAARLAGTSVPAILLVTFPLFLLSEWSWLARPQIWSFLSFAIFILLLERHRRINDKIVYLAFPVMVFWSNLHAGAILAFPVLFAYLVGEAIWRLLGRSTLSSKGYIALGVLAALLVMASLITPYSDVHILKGLFGHIARGGGFSDTQGLVLHNLDWKSYSFSEYPIFVYIMALTAILFGLGWKRFSPSHLILLGGLAYMGIKNSRHIALFFLGCAALLPQYAEAAFQLITARIRLRHKRVFRALGTFAAIVLIIYVSKAVYFKKGFFDLGILRWRYPYEAVAFIKTHTLPPALFNSREWGGFLQWELFPEYKVFWDGRDNSKEMFATGARITNGDPIWQQALDEHNVNTLILMPCDLWQGRRFGILNQLKENPYYAPVFANNFSLVFVRKDAVEKDWLRAHKLPRIVIDDTILSAAHMLASDNSRRFAAFFEMFRIYNSRGQHHKAVSALKTYLSLTPARDPIGEKVYQMYSAALKGADQQRTDKQK